MLGIDEAYSLVRTVAPTEEHLSFFDLKSYLRVDTDDENDLIERLGVASREFIEKATNRQIMTATFRLAMDQWPCFESSSFAEIALPRPPLQSITSFQYVDTNGATQALALTTDYLIDVDSEPGRVFPAYGKSWPSVRQFPGAIAITYRSGWSDPDNVPETLKQAVRMLAAHWYRNREAVQVGGTTKEIELAIASLVYADGVLLAA